MLATFGGQQMPKIRWNHSSQLKDYIATLRIRDNRESRAGPIGPVETQIPGKGGIDLSRTCRCL